jgi:putative transposase
LLDISLSSFYYKKQNFLEKYREESKAIIAIWNESPTYGYRRIHHKLRRLGLILNHKTVIKIMNELKIEAIYPRKRLKPKESRLVTSKKTPYLLRFLEISSKNQVWTTDITYLRLPSGFVYLSAILDIYSRFVLSWKIYTTMDEELCLDTLEEAVSHYGIPEIINTDQGSQYTGEAWIKAVEALGTAKLSHDGKGRWADNIFIERFWRTAKHEHINIHEFNSVKELRTSLKEYINYYNHKRLHSRLNYKTPAEIYLKNIAAPTLKLK